MRKTVWACDNCGQIEQDLGKMASVRVRGGARLDICPDCIEGNMHLETPMSTWPHWVPREAVAVYLEKLIREGSQMRREVKDMRRKLKSMAKELTEIRSLAGDAAAKDDPQQAKHAVREIVAKSAGYNGE